MRKFEEITEKEAISIAHIASDISNVSESFSIVGRSYQMITLYMKLPKNNETCLTTDWDVQIFRNGDIQRQVNGVCLPLHAQLFLFKTLTTMNVKWSNER